MLNFLLNISSSFFFYVVALAGRLQKPYYPGKDYGISYIIVVAEGGPVSCRPGRRTSKKSSVWSTEEPDDSGRSNPFHRRTTDGSRFLLYPGKWELTAEAFDFEGIVLLSAFREINIEREHQHGTTPLDGGAGLLTTLDASKIEGFGTIPPAGFMFAKSLRHFHHF